MYIIKVLRFDNKYDQLVDILTEEGGKVPDSRRRDRDPKSDLIDWMVYYKVHLANRKEVKGKFNNLVRNHIVVQIIRSIYLEIEISQDYIPIVLWFITKIILDCILENK